ncbi:MAG: hypothetical protein HY814_10750 [Candidatus Riflebacteria bacterium]|nr:hypothetical protein [Candidatus Riflebacteria bacterium]
MRSKVPKSGIGTIFLIALSIVVVLAIMMMANSLLTSKVREQTVDISVSDRAAIAAESAVEEVAYSLLESLNDPASKQELYKKLRMFEPGKATPPPDDVLLEDARSVVVRPELTERAYQDLTDVRVGEVKAGPYEQLALGPTDDSNESYGTFGFRQSTRVTPPGHFRSVEEQVFFKKAFKVLLLAPPCPFNKYSLFMKEPRRFRSYYDLYQQAVAEVERQNATASPADQVTLPPWPIADPTSTRPIFTTSGTVDPQDLTLASLAPGATGGAKQLAASLTQLFARIGARYQRQTAESAAEYDSKKYYDQLSQESLRKHATHVFDNFAELVGFLSRDGVLELNGFYFVQREVILNQPWTGRGVIATEAPEGITVRSALKRGEGRLTLIASRGPISLSALPPAEVLAADLVAPNGVLDGYRGKKVLGTVMVRDLDSSTDLFSPGPAVTRPPDSDYEPWAGQGDLAPAYARQLAFFLNPGFVNRQYLSERQRNP